MQTLPIISYFNHNPLIRIRLCLIFFRQEKSCFMFFSDMLCSLFCKKMMWKAWKFLLFVFLLLCCGCIYVVFGLTGRWFMHFFLGWYLVVVVILWEYWIKSWMLFWCAESADDIYPYATFHLPEKENLAENIREGFLEPPSSQRLSNAGETIPIRQVSFFFFFTFRYAIPSTVHKIMLSPTTPPPHPRRRDFRLGNFHFTRILRSWPCSKEKAIKWCSLYCSIWTRKIIKYHNLSAFMCGERDTLDKNLCQKKYEGIESWNQLIFHTGFVYITKL